MFLAVSLAEVEEDLQISVVDNFDLVAGTSTVGNIVLGTGAGFSPANLVDFYLDDGPAISLLLPYRVLSQIVRQRYSAEPLREVYGVMVDVVIADTDTGLDARSPIGATAGVNWQPSLFAGTGGESQWSYAAQRRGARYERTDLSYALSAS